MASKLAVLVQRRPAIAAAALVVVALLAARFGHPVGMWDGPI
ncbi:MAG TPA: hypothetical protein VFA97_04520 [Gaiellaceae bacterium]|nr:hypothetical protein [Gaiellaceae bacterium]